jgi:hypothetical protein
LNSYNNSKIYSIDEITDGQACTCEIGINNEKISMETSILISACDNGVYYDVEINFETKKQNNLDDEADFILWLNSFDNNLNVLTDCCMWFDWKLDNVIFWLKNDGIFKRCIKCNCIYSYLKNSFVCKNKYCKNIN